ncbi:MAG: hypothetical protein KJ990_00285 [Proteobacteria bacterium]|nr:hypothetical protein [Pseudomonadota bacterium]MBU1648367.1 hypothetical protein [Pseudomonadota bacterium]
MRRRAPHDDVIKRMTLAASLELKPIDDRARQSERLSVRQQGKRIMRPDFRLELASCWSSRSRTGVFFSRTHSQSTKSKQKTSFHNFLKSIYRETGTFTSDIDVFDRQDEVVNRFNNHESVPFFEKK